MGGFDGYCQQDRRAAGGVSSTARPCSFAARRDTEVRGGCHHRARDDLVRAALSCRLAGGACVHDRASGGAGGRSAGFLGGDTARVAGGPEAGPVRALPAGVASKGGLMGNPSSRGSLDLVTKDQRFLEHARHLLIEAAAEGFEG